MDRRTFLGWVGVGTLASSLPMILAACTSKEEESPVISETPNKDSPVAIDTSVREDGFQALGTVKQLDQEGKILDKTNAAQAVLIFRNPEDNNLSALNPKCPHQSCTVDIKSEDKLLACPCHGSKFAFDGTVINGPAKKPLNKFEVKQEEDLILVKV